MHIPILQINIHLNWYTNESTTTNSQASICYLLAMAFVTNWILIQNDLPW